ncbi:MAG TPA: hypothetical protein VFW98_12110 [Gemmatimonadaceae bacterium]|nr:hypothetical protein [Gemmatimonadaceae bacterium]
MTDQPEVPEADAAVPAHDAMTCRACGSVARASEGYPCAACGTFICLMCSFRGTVLCSACAAKPPATAGG